MFTIFKHKTKLADVIPERYVDIHNHLLPAIDDGSKSVEETRYLQEKMFHLGITNCISTPHISQGLWENTHQTIENAFHKVVDLQPKSCEIIRFAAEHMIDFAFLEKIKKNEILPIKDSYVLVEMSYRNEPSFLFDAIFELIGNGFIPVLAHPERYLFYHNSLKHFEKLLNQHVKFQLNLLSCVGYYGKEVSKIAELLLENNMYHFSGSDIHVERHIAGFYETILFKKTQKLEDLLQKNVDFWV